MHQVPDLTACTDTSLPPLVLVAGSCESSLAWVAKGNITTLHSDINMLCGNTGSCNYNRGDCKCLEGYVGIGCERSTLN